MENKPIQDYFPENYAVCYGCGRLNEHGLQIKSFWQGDESVCHFKPREYHTAVPGFTYGGLLASLVDCHATGTAAAAVYVQEGRPFDSQPAMRFVTGELKVRYVAPTPIEALLELRAKVTEIRRNRATVQVSVFADGKKTVEGNVIVFQVPENMQGGDG